MDFDSDDDDDKKEVHDSATVSTKSESIVKSSSVENVTSSNHPILTNQSSPMISLISSDGIDAMKKEIDNLKGVLMCTTESLAGATKQLKEKDEELKQLRMEIEKLSAENLKHKSSFDALSFRFGQDLLQAKEALLKNNRDISEQNLIAINEKDQKIEELTKKLESSEALLRAVSEVFIDHELYNGILCYSQCMHKHFMHVQGMKGALEQLANGVLPLIKGHHDVTQIEANIQQMKTHREVYLEDERQRNLKSLVSAIVNPINIFFQRKNMPDIHSQQVDYNANTNNMSNGMPNVAPYYYLNQGSVPNLNNGMFSPDYMMAAYSAQNGNSYIPMGEHYEMANQDKL